MEEQAHKPGLIRSRRTAVFGLVLTGLVAAVSFRATLSHSESPSSLASSVRFPACLGSLAKNTALCAYFLWLGVLFFQKAFAMERVLVTGWFSVILLSPIQKLVSRSSSVAIQ